MPYMPGVINTANSLVGSSMLAMPFVLSKCGIILGSLLIIVCGLICETSCHLLVVVTKASQRGSFEELGRAVFGSAGKRVVQTAMSLCMVNACIVWFVVLGNILPRLAAEYGFIEAETPAARQYILVGIATFVVFPISLLKNVMGAIAILSQISMGFYTMFALWVISLGGSAFVEMRWVKHVPWWEWGGLGDCLPIVSAALTAQTQFFLIYQNMPSNTIAEMRSCVFWAAVIVCITYMVIGTFGYAYIAQKVLPAVDKPWEPGEKAALESRLLHVPPNFMAAIDEGIVTDAFQLGFALSIIMSYPLVVYPLRDTLWTIWLGQAGEVGLPTGGGGSPDTEKRATPPPPMPQKVFYRLTAGAIALSVSVALVIQDLDAMLMLSGATGNCTVAFYLPALFFVVWADRYPSSVRPFLPSSGGWLRQSAKVVFVIGLITSTSGIVGGLSIILGTAEDAPAVGGAVLSQEDIAQASALQAELRALPLSALVDRLEAEGVTHDGVNSVLDNSRHVDAAVPLLMHAVAERETKAAAKIAEVAAAEVAADKAAAAATLEAERLVEAEAQAATAAEAALAAQADAEAVEIQLLNATKTAAQLQVKAAEAAERLNAEPEPEPEPEAVFSPAPADADCAGSWSACTPACETAEQRTWTETVAPVGSGEPCPGPWRCKAGEGDCLADVDCLGGWSTCAAECTPMVYSITVQRSGKGVLCGATDGETAPCLAGQGACPQPPPPPAPAPPPPPPPLAPPVAAPAAAAVPPVAASVSPPEPVATPAAPAARPVAVEAVLPVPVAVATPVATSSPPPAPSVATPAATPVATPVATPAATTVVEPVAPVAAPAVQPAAAVVAVPVVEPVSAVVTPAEPKPAAAAEAAASGLAAPAVAAEKKSSHHDGGM